MTLRQRLHRTGAAFVIAGIFLSAVDVDPAGEPAGATAAEAPAATVSAAPAPVAADAAPDSPATPPPGPQAGDLTHLTFSATDSLAASLIAPADGRVAPASSAGVEVETVKGAGVELRVGDTVIPFSQIGKRTVDSKTGATRYTYYGVVLAPGPNAVALTPLGAAGLRGETTLHRVYGPAKPATLALSASGPFRADGSSPDSVFVEGRDAWGNKAAAGSVVHVALLAGDARLERAAAPVDPAAASSPAPLATASPGLNAVTPARAGLDLTLDGDGIATLRVLPGLTPGELVLRADAGDVSREARFFLSPNLRRPFVNGLVSAGAGAVPGIPDAPDGVADGTASRRGRVALFGTGAVGTSLATLAYDTADRLRRTPAYGGAYGADPNDRPYAITGDASTRRDDALSRDHLFARLDNGRNSAQWGEFRARTGTDNAPGGFDQLLDGAKLELVGAQRRVALFAARNDVGYDRRVFAPSGLANGVVLRPDIVVGSEVVVLATVDARTGAILTQSPLTRGVDYSLEYATGQLRFIEVPLPFDEAFNPHQIVLTYQYDAPGNAARTLGGRAETSLGRNHAIRLGAGYVNDSSGAGNVVLASQDAAGTLAGGAWSVAHATSRGALLAVSPDAPLAGAGGAALHAQYSRAAGSDRLTFLFDRTDAGFSDPFGGLSTPGLLNERLTYAHRYAGGTGEVALDVGHQANAGAGIAGNSQSTATLRTRRAITRRFALTGALEHRVAGATAATGSTGAPLQLPGVTAPVGLGSLASPTALPAQTSTQASLGFDWRATSALDLSANRIETLGGANAVQPAQTDAQLTLDLGKGGRAFARERWSAAPVASFAAATQALTAPTGGTRATEFGFARRVGPATTVDTSYVVDQTANGSDAYAALGVRERIALGRLRGDAFFQHGTSAGAGALAGGFDLYGTSLGYADAHDRFRATASTQLRTGDGRGVSLSLGALGALSPDFSLFANVNDARAAGGHQSDERIGLAWRPSRSDVGVTLLQFERRDGTSAADRTQSGVLSVEQVLRVRSRTELTGRYAYKLDGDAFYAAHSSLAGVRAVQAIGARLDVGAEVRAEDLRGIAGARATALAVEGGLRLGDRTRLGIGYNVRGTADPSLATTPTRRGFYTTVTSVIDRLLGWGRRS